eukprot:Blabericola_migrator_1__6570@NODE_330_length_9712_cov_53_719129_g267_i0_p4_GENE_NODE_330_length_9712_cov_53_719129_g267_i0NODE_330_length_9712_cov_53_719129_g267_i0_p4_ORF_typecomplete_len154_score16_95_NODE_330_length_9712_cov_53_719129_g267_i051125573
MANIQAFVLASPADPKLLMSFLNGTMSTLRGNAHGAILVEKGYANMMASNVLGLLVMQPNQASPVVKMMNDFAEDHMCNTLQETFGLDRVVEEAPITATITNYLSRGMPPCVTRAVVWLPHSPHNLYHTNSFLQKRRSLYCHWYHHWLDHHWA